MSATEASAVSSPAPRRLEAARPRYGELAIRGLLGLCALLSVATTVGIVVALLEPTVEFFGDVSLKDHAFPTCFFDFAQDGLSALRTLQIIDNDRSAG